MKKLMLLAATLVVAAIALSAPKATNAQTTAGNTMLYYININSTLKTLANGAFFTCAVVKSPNSSGQLGRINYNDGQGNTLFSGETILNSITNTSAVALFHTPIAGDYLAYTIVTINVDSDHTSVTLVKVNRSRSVVWSTSFNLDSNATGELNPIPAPNQ